MTTVREKVLSILGDDAKYITKLLDLVDEAYLKGNYHAFEITRGGGGTEPIKDDQQQIIGFKITLPNALPGMVAGGNNFITYDKKAVLVHELSHLLLNLLDLESDDEEVYVAVMATANDLDDVERIRNTSYDTLKSLANRSSSYENIFNDARQYTDKIVGSAENIRYYRQGYQTVGDWKDHTPGASTQEELEQIPGNYYFNIKHGIQVHIVGSPSADGDVGNAVNSTSNGKHALSGATPEGGLYGGGGNDYLDGGYGDDYLEGNGGKDTLIGGGGNDILWSGAGDDNLDGGENDDIIFGDIGNDTLVGGKGSDELYGGTGSDTYIAGAGDTINDDDGKGRVAFEGSMLSGGKAKQGETKPDGSGTYKGDGGTYTLSNGTLTFLKGSETLTIQKFVNGDLGIYLGEEKPRPGTPSPNFPSPLVLDLNGDGITSTFISEGSTYFDLDINGVRERTGWVQADDALLVFDKNQDGIINNGTELFGNHTALKNGTKAANGFEALKEYDENQDGVIDSKDNIYNTLQLWQDGNSDGVSQTNELKTLSELGVKSIATVYATIESYDERNITRQRSFFTTETVDADGNTVVGGGNIDDVWFATKNTKFQRKVA